MFEKNLVEPSEQNARERKFKTLICDREHKFKRLSNIRALSRLL